MCPSNSTLGRNGNDYTCVLTELEKQMKIENLFVTWQQRSAQSNMPISVSYDLNICDLSIE